MNAHERPRLGRLLVEAGLIGEEQLATALRVHEETGRPLGEIVTEDLNLVSVPVLADLLLVQQRWKPLGAMLVENGIIGREQLLAVLEEQARTGRPLGELVRERFYVSQEMLDVLLRRQRELEIDLEQGYGSGLRSALTRRAPTEQPGDETRAAAQADLGTLSGRITLAEASPDPHVHLAIRAVEHREGKIESLRKLVDRQREEIDRLRGALQERQLDVIELRQRVEELETLAAAVNGSTSAAG